MAWFGDFLHRYPDLAVYLAVGLGYLIGGYKIKGFGLGPVTGSLFAGLLIGQLGHVPVSGTAKSILFLMFIFGIGYSVGPQFFRSLKGDGGRSAVFGIFVTSVGLGTAFAVARLAAFVAMVGLHAGPVFIEAAREVGFGLVLGGAVVTLTPLVAGLFFGRYVLRMNPLLLLGALAGAQTMTAALAAVQEKSGSPVAVLGYTGAVPFGHILLTTWGTVIVWLIA